MKHLPIYLLVMLLWPSSSCVTDSTKDCIYIDNNLKLEFVNINKKGEDTFLEKVKRVHVFIFDEEHLFVQKKVVEKNDLAIFAGTEMSLPPGKYFVVCWGNALDQTTFSDLDNSTLLFDAFTKNSLVDSKLIAPNGDPLYYGPKSAPELLEVVVPESEQVVKEVPFRSAHAQIRVYVKGMQDLNDKGEALAPLLSLDQVPDQTDFQLNRSNSYIKYQSIAEFIDFADKSAFMFQFNSPLLDGNTKMNVYVNKQSDQEQLAEVNIAQFMVDHNTQYVDVDQIEVLIQIEFKGAEVIVTLPKWEHIPVDPEL